LVVLAKSAKSLTQAFALNPALLPRLKKAGVDARYGAA
jgi:hypothetical protein